MEESSYWSSGEEPDLEAAFFDYVREFEEAPDTTLGDQLRKIGRNFGPPEELSDAEVRSEMERLAFAMADLNAYLESTDHLSDRRLYEEIWSETSQPSKAITNPDSVWHFDFTSSGSEQEIDAFLRYYADDETRARWAIDFPEDALPPQELPPYPRPWLPQARR